MPYDIKIRTKEGTYEYEKEDLSDIDLLLMQHPDYDELSASQKKLRCDKCNIELSEVFVQHSSFRSYKLCKACNELFLKYDRNIKKLEKLKQERRTL